MAGSTNRGDFWQVIRRLRIHIFGLNQIFRRVGRVTCGRRREVTSIRRLEVRHAGTRSAVGRVEWGSGLRVREVRDAIGRIVVRRGIVMIRLRARRGVVGRGGLLRSTVGRSNAVTGLTGLGGLGERMGGR